MIKYLMHAFAFALLGLSMSSKVIAADDEAQLATELVNPGYEEKPSWFKNSFMDIREDIDEATAANKRLMLYFYQDGCPYCAKLLRDNFGQEDIAEKTRQYFDTIAINMWGDREVVDLAGDDTTEKSFAKSLKVQFTPTLLLLDEAGHTVIRINGYYAPHKFYAILDYVGLKLEKQLAVREYLAKQIPVAAIGKLHRQAEYIQPPHLLRDVQRRNGRPVLVFFEQRQCRVCDELHTDILLREESLELLGNFDIALVDIWSNESLQKLDGVTSTAKQWASELAIQYAPTMVFFDEAGREVIRIEGYFKAFHIQSTMDYVSSKAYLRESEFQRYLGARADALRAQGIQVDLME